MGVQGRDAACSTRPADVLAVYLGAVESLKTLTGSDVHQQIAGLRLRRACHQALGTTGEFERHLAALRADQKRKAT